MISATLDSNIYVSALNYGGPGLRILEMARAGMIRIDLSNGILEEFGGVLRDKFKWAEADIELAQREIASFANHVSPQETLLVVPGDDDDNRITECAGAARSDYIITKDKHLLTMISFRGAKIVKPEEFLTISRSR